MELFCRGKSLGYASTGSNKASHAAVDTSQKRVSILSKMRFQTCKPAEKKERKKITGKKGRVKESRSDVGRLGRRRDGSTQASLQYIIIQTSFR